MRLLDDALQVSGGLEQWRKLSRLTIHLSIGGALFNRMRESASMKDMVVQGGVHEPTLEMTGFTAPDRRALYRPDRVALERSDGQLLGERRATAAEFRRSLKGRTWDEMQLAFYCGSLIRNYLDIPFALADAGVVVTQEGSTNGRNEQLHALQVRFPERLAAHTAESTLYFDNRVLLRRQEYAALHADGKRIVQMYSGHQCYSGILVPTLCWLLLVNEHDAAMNSRQRLVDIEVFDVGFE